MYENKANETVIDTIISDLTHVMALPSPDPRVATPELLFNREIQHYLPHKPANSLSDHAAPIVCFS